MPLPIFTTDWFSKPEPTGSINGTVARMMATAGAALSERVEKQSALAEARLRAPAVTKVFASGYEKISRGDFSGFSDLARASGASAANPLLAQLSKEANDLGWHLANNYTQSAILEERLKSQSDLQDKRITAQKQAQATAFESRGKLQDDAQQHQLSMLEEREFEKQVLATEKYNEEIRQKRIIETKNAQASGREPDYTGLEEKPLPARQARKTISPTGLPVRDEADILNAQDDPDGIITSESLNNSAPLPSRNESSAGPAQGSLPQEQAPPQPQQTQAKPATAGSFPFDPFNEKQQSAAPRQVKVVAKTPNGQPITEEQFSSMTWAQRETKIPNGEEITFGDGIVVIGPEKATSDEMEVTAVTETPSGPNTRREKKKEPEEGSARERFINSIERMNTIPEAADFVMENWMKSGKATPPIGFREVKEKGGNTVYQMYATTPDGKRIPYTPPSGRDENGKPLNGSDIVSKDFYKAYDTMITTKKKVYEDNALGFARVITPEQKSYLERIEDTDTREFAKNQFVLLRKGVKEGGIDQQEFVRRLKEFRDKKNEKAELNTEEETLRKKYGVSAPDDSQKKKVEEEKFEKNYKRELTLNDEITFYEKEIERVKKSLSNAEKKEKTINWFIEKIAAAQRELKQLRGQKQPQQK